MTEIELAYCKQEESYLNEVYLYMIPNNRRRMLGFPVLRRRLINKNSMKCRRPVRRLLDIQ